MPPSAPGSPAAIAGAGDETGCALDGFDVSGNTHGAVVTPPAGGGQWGGLPISAGPPVLCWAAGMDDKAVVTVGDQRFELAPGEVLTFGRDPSCAVRLDPDDLGISRLAGSIEQDAATWWVLNRSTVRPLEVVDEIGIRTVVAPGRRLAVFGPFDGGGGGFGAPPRPVRADGAIGAGAGRDTGGFGER